MLRVGVELVALVAVRRLAGDGVVVRLVGGDDPAIRVKGRVLEQAVVVASVVDRRRHQDRCATVVVETGLEAEVLDDVGDDALLAFRRAHQLLHRGPAFADDGFLKIVQRLGLLVEPRIDGFS